MFKILFFSTLLLFHPVHVTLTSIDYIPEKDCYKVFVRMYYDDYLLDNKQHGRNVGEMDFLDGNYDSRNEVEQFIRGKIVIEENEVTLIGKLLNMELADNEISLNMEYQAKNKPKTLRVKSMIMTNLYKDQLNMVIVRVNDFEEGVKLTSDLTEHTFKIK
jgi:Domain of unknown function (DUF6702)